MTGLEIIAIRQGKASLFKVRHDGYAVEDWIKDNPVPTATSTTEAILQFKEWFFHTDRYGPEDPSGSDVETNYLNGYEFVPVSSNFEDMLNQACDELQNMEQNGTLPNGSDFDGLTCGYGDYGLLIDLDNNNYLLV